MPGEIPLAALAFRYRPRFRTIQVYPKSVARKHAQALALSIGRIPRLWQQKAFCEKCRTGGERAFIFLGGAAYESHAAEIRFLVPAGGDHEREEDGKRAVG